MRRWLFALLAPALAACEPRAAAPQGTGPVAQGAPAPAPRAAPEPELTAEPLRQRASAPVSTDTPATVPASDTTPKPREVCPPEMALIGDRFCIDRWEATTTGIDGKPHSPYLPVTHLAVRAESRPGAVPQAYISMQQADQACVRAGKRLCTTAQWVDACRGIERPKRTYPYGIQERPKACNTQQGSGHPLMALHAGKRPTDSFWMNDSRINQLASTVAPTGAFEECATPEGVSDMVGNLLEWTRGERPLLMGGYYLDAKENGEGCSYVTLRHGEKYHDFSTGFRCCLEPSREALRARKREIQLASTTQQVGMPPAVGRGSSGPAGTDATTRPIQAEAPRDPPGFRAFANPAAKLPPKPEPPPFESESAACPVDMALVEGKRCNAPEQACKRWLVVPGQEPERSCAEFAQPVCKRGTRSMRFCIDRHEYTPEGWELPLVNVSWGEAQNICGAMDKRLCLEDEWEFACEGPEAFPYPYGNVRNGAACNHDRTDLFDERGKLVDQRVPTESLPNCKSPFGVFNLVGNVDEWTTRVNKEPPWRSILRGGWWLTGRNRCRAATESHSEIYAGPQTGFRCCRAARK